MTSNLKCETHPFPKCLSSSTKEGTGRSPPGAVVQVQQTICEHEQEDDGFCTVPGVGIFSPGSVTWCLCTARRANESASCCCERTRFGAFMFSGQYSEAVTCGFDKRATLCDI